MKRSIELPPLPAKKGSFSVEVSHRKDGVSTLAIAGDSEAHGDPRSLVASAMAELLAKGRHKLVIDTTALEWMTVDVAGAIVGEFLRLSDAGGQMVFAGLDDEVGPLLQDLGVLEFIGNTETVEEAVAWLHENVTETRPISDQRLTITGKKHPGGALVLGLNGSLGEAEGEKLIRLVEKQIAQGAQKLVIDGQKLLDAAGVASFVVLVERAEKLGARVSFATMWGIPRAVIGALGLDALLDIHADVEAAVAALGGRGKKHRR